MTLIRNMSIADVPAALRLCRVAGWNQLPEDWSRLIEYQPDGCFVAEVAGELVGTVTTTSYKTNLAWIGMMLVDEAHRRRGIATSLMKASLDYLRECSVACIKLDATPLGQPVYERLGFRAECSFHRWERVFDQELVTGELAVNCNKDELTQDHWQMDQLAFGANRREWLTRLCQVGVVITSDAGFGLLRPGYLADYLGPVIADSPQDAHELVSSLLDQPHAKRVFWDLPHLDPEMIALPQSLGFHPVRDLTRMWMGTELPAADLRRQFAIAEPSCG